MNKPIGFQLYAFFLFDSKLVSISRFCTRLHFSNIFRTLDMMIRIFQISTCALWQKWFYYHFYLMIAKRAPFFLFEKILSISVMMIMFHHIKWWIEFLREQKKNLFFQFDTSCCVDQALIKFKFFFLFIVHIHRLCVYVCVYVCFVLFCFVFQIRWW